MFEDECHFQRSATIIRGWYEKGKTIEIKSPAVKEKVSILGALGMDGKVITMETDIFNAESFKKFLQKILKSKTGHMQRLLILDNARFHHAKANKEFIESIKGKLELMFLPPYSPDLNPIESLWKQTRRNVTHNRYFETLDELKDALSNYFKKWNKANSILSNLSAFY